MIDVIITLHTLHEYESLMQFRPPSAAGQSSTARLLLYICIWSLLAVPLAAALAVVDDKLQWIRIDESPFSRTKRPIARCILWTVLAYLRTLVVEVVSQTSP